MKTSKVTLNYWLFRYRDSGMINDGERKAVWARVKSGEITTLLQLSSTLNGIA